MKTTLKLLLPLLLAAGCGDSTTTNTDMAKVPDMAASPPDLTSVPDMAMVPAVPKVGAQIDRMGRPTINVAATDPFDLDLSKANPVAKGRDVTRDAYNQDSDPTKWVANWAPVINVNLGVYDGADTVCGNQLLAAVTVDAMRYSTLASVLADDRLWLDTSQTACGLYLGVEANATLLGGALKECGGRTPTEDVVDETYTFLTIGPADFVKTMKFAITDGPTMNKEGAPALTTFPFLADPN